MGYLDHGQWISEVGPPTQGGAYLRTPTSFRSQIGKNSEFEAQSGRYHLYVSLSCPWAHRVLLMRTLKGLEACISLSVVDPLVKEDGWQFSNRPGCLADPLFSAQYLREIYLQADLDYTGRVTVPVLWDRQKKTIVNNESLELMRMLDCEFDAFAQKPHCFYPPTDAEQIDTVINSIYHSLANAVYRAGFARSQVNYDTAVETLFTALDTWDALLSQQPFLCGEKVTEADWCLFVVLVRFDCAYYDVFGCNRRQIADYPHLSSYLSKLYEWPGVAETCNLDHIREHYYHSFASLQTRQIATVGASQSSTLGKQ
jgi:glutathionyl-hydroquinone reductase